MLEYIAGFFDAEGSIWVGKNDQNRLTMTAYFTQKNPKILEWIQSELGGDLYPPAKGSDCYTLWFRGSKAKSFLERFSPYLSVKNSEANLALELYADRLGITGEDAQQVWRARDRNTLYVMSDQSPAQDVMYIAGFFDGDGHIGDDLLRLTQKSVYILEEVESRYAGNIHKQRNGVYTWTVYARKARSFLGEIKPYLKCDRYDFDRVLKYAR